MFADIRRNNEIQVIDWNPPPHAPATNLLFQIFGSTAGQTVRAAIDASGEPPIPQLREWYYQESEQQQQPSSSTEFWQLCQMRDEYRAKYHRYWADSRMRTRSGRCVDGVILPVAPSAAVEEGRFEYYGGLFSLFRLFASTHVLSFVLRGLRDSSRHEKKGCGWGQRKRRLDRGVESLRDFTCY